MENIKEILKKYKIVTTFILLLLASLFLYIFVSADEDIYENQISATVNSLNIIDGTENFNGGFDANDEAGNDSSPNNKIVRNFDRVIYQVSYGLSYKSDSTLTEEQKTLDLTRNVIVDVLIPTSLETIVSVTDEMNSLQSNLVVESNGVRYNYYKEEINNVSLSGTNTLEIILSNINGKNGDILSPIIRVREATDNVQEKDITSSTNVSNVEKINVQDVTISAKEAYGVELYNSNPQKDEQGKTTKFISGVLVYLPQDENKGIKGIQIPNEITFNITSLSNVDSTYATIKSGASIIDYNSESGYTIDRLPNAYSTNNGNSTIENASLNNNKTSTFVIKINNLKYHDQYTALSNGTNCYYISSKVFIFDNEKTDLVDTNKIDITYDLSTSVTPSNTITLTDSYKSFVGDYISTIDFYNSSAITTPEEHGHAVFNYNEEFYIQNTIKYGFNSGDKLENGFINYIKIDNTAFKMQDVGNVSDQSKDYYIEFIGDTPNADVKYGLGEWNSSYFKLKTNSPGYCPSSLSNLTKEELMDYYGGPCIEENENIEWVDSIDDAAQQNKDGNIIIFKLTTNEFDKSSQAIIKLKAKAVKSINNIGNTYKITSRGMTRFDNKDYYLSEIPKISVSNQQNDLTYVKTEYINFVPSGDKTYLNDVELSNNIGNTVLISPFKASINNIELKDSYSSPKNTFYSGMTDPIEVTINPVIYKSDYDATITGANISVYLPIELELYEDETDRKYNRETSGQVINMDGKNYKVYNYDYSEDDINFENESPSGTIPNLTLHAYIDISTQDNTNDKIIATISGRLKPTNTSTSEYTDVTPSQKRQFDVDITLRNTKEINAIGTSNLLRIDENGSFIYNMRAANVSNTSASLALLYILPYKGDGIGEGSNFDGKISVKLANELPSGYNALYTTDSPKTLLSNEINGSNINWENWSNVQSDIEDITAIKIVSNSEIEPSEYFAGSNGINLVITTDGNKESDRYLNNFYMIHYDADICTYEDITSEECITQKSNQLYSSNITKVSVFNRIISGYVFEDSDYNGFYNTEKRLKDISVDLYKLNSSEFIQNDPTSYISENDELIKEGITNNDGYYKFENLQSGNYYVKYKFDCNKFTVTEKNKIDITQGDTRNIDSDVQMVNTDDESKCYAVSNIQVLNNENVEVNHIDAGLRVRQEFDIKISKYITNIKVTTQSGTDSYDYDKQTKVKFDVRNLKNTTFTVTYGIEIENTKYFPGTIGNIIETIPEGMYFNPNLDDNIGWYEVDGKLYYANLSKTLIMPGEKYYLTIVLGLDTANAGSYINFVAANNLRIQPVTTRFIELPDADETVIDKED